jgi:23S rRNA (adenine-N6)-dimethyltransferase
MKMLLNKPSNGFQRGVIVLEKGAAKRFTSKWVKESYVVLNGLYNYLTCKGCSGR